MNNTLAEHDDYDPAAARVIAKVRMLMLIAALTTGLAIAAVFGVIGYRLFTWKGSAPSTPALPDVTAALPKGARVVNTATVSDRIVVTLDVGGRVEIRTFNLWTLKPTGRLRLNSEP